MSDYKTPLRLKGFSDFFASDMKLREYVIGIFKSVYEKYGYEPLETPALEYSELILGQSGEEAEKQYYRFKDNGDRDVMLKYEVMTAMCRAVAQNLANIPMPYKRYQIQKVWRAENVQKGRYREFTQCDADTIGSSSMMCDAEFIQMGLEIVKNLGFDRFVARISNKKFLDGLADYLNIDNEKRYGFQMSIDKLDKIGKEAVVEEMVSKRNIDRESAEKAMNIINPENFKDLSFRETVSLLMETVGKTELGKAGLNELLKIVDYLEASNVDSLLYRFDTTIARGLASYTGPVWEFTVLDGGVGSIAGCGRYDNAIGKYLGNAKVPATGGSFGIERICDIIKDRRMKEFDDSNAKVLVTVFNEELLNDSIKVANQLREKGISTMLYPDFDKLPKQLKFADRKGIEYSIVIGPDEKSKGLIQVKNMINNTQRLITIDDFIIEVE